MRQFPSDIVAVIDRLITQNEEELAELWDSLPTNALMWSEGQRASLDYKKAIIGYLREHGKTNALLEYAYGLLSELLEVLEQKTNFLEQEHKDEVSKINRHISRLKNAQQNFNQAIDAAREIIGEQPNLFRGRGKYSELARRVCRKLEWHEKKERTVRRDLRAAEIIPESD